MNRFMKRFRFVSRIFQTWTRLMIQVRTVLHKGVLCEVEHCSSNFGNLSDQFSGGSLPFNYTIESLSFIWVLETFHNTCEFLLFSFRNNEIFRLRSAAFHCIVKMVDDWTTFFSPDLELEIDSLAAILSDVLVPAENNKIKPYFGFDCQCSPKQNCTSVVKDLWEITDPKSNWKASSLTS